MPSFALNAYEKKDVTFSAWVWYESNAALLEGEAVCYNFDYYPTDGAVTNRDARRRARVETPSTTNAQWFAGVAARDYAAVSTGQLIEIYLPGSVCNISCGKDTDTVIDRGCLTFDVTTGFKGEFRYDGLPGEGSALPLQTTTGDASDPGKCQALLQVGSPSGGLEVVTAVNGALTCMVGGTSRIVGADIAGDCTITLADGLKLGLRKKFIQVDTDLETSDIVITVTTGMRQDGTALQTVTYNNAQTTLNMGIVLGWSESWAVTSLGDGEPDLA